jgi:hypothetical protein
VILIETLDSKGIWHTRSERSCAVIARFEAASLAQSLGSDRVRITELAPRLATPQERDALDELPEELERQPEQQVGAA